MVNLKEDDVQNIVNTNDIHSASQKPQGIVDATVDLLNTDISRRMSLKIAFGITTAACLGLGGNQYLKNAPLRALEVSYSELKKGCSYLLSEEYKSHLQSDTLSNDDLKSISLNLREMQIVISNFIQVSDAFIDAYNQPSLYKEIFGSRGKLLQHSTYRLVSDHSKPRTNAETIKLGLSELVKLIGAFEGEFTLKNAVCKLPGCRDAERLIDEMLKASKNILNNLV